MPGAHEGKGMGNQFLDDLRQADVLIHVVDMAGSTNEKGEPIEPGNYDPAEDIKFLEVELDMWYNGILKKGWERFARVVQQEHGNIVKALAKQLSGLGVTEEMLKDSTKKLGLDTENFIISSWDEDKLMKLATDLRKKTKPMMIAANKSDIPAGKKNFERIKKEFPHLMIIACSAESELALKEAARHKMIDYIPGEKDFKIISDKLTDKQRNALNFIKTNVLEVYEYGTGVQSALNKAVFELLGYVAIYPGGVNKLTDSEGRVLPDCFLMPPKTTALDFAFRLHTDFGKNFIKAIDVKKKMPVGKDYPLKSGDVVEIAYKK